MVQFCTCISVTPCSYIRDVPIVLVAIGNIMAYYSPPVYISIYIYTILFQLIKLLLD